MKDLIHEYRWTIGITVFFYILEVGISVYKIAKYDKEKNGGKLFDQIRMDFKNGWWSALWRYSICQFVWDW